jgi:acyl-CoA dehydrogenase
VSADPRAPFPPKARSAPPPGRGPTAAEAYPFFFAKDHPGPEHAQHVRAKADELLFDELEPETAEASVAAAKRILDDVGKGIVLADAIGPFDKKLGGGSLLRCLAREEIAYASPLADAVIAVQGLGARPLILEPREGDSRVDRTVLLESARTGAKVCFGFAVTEPDAGSDLSRIACEARRDGQDYVLSGTKAFISNAGLATHYTLFARTGEGKKGISCFLVPADAARTELLELNAAHPVGVLRFDGARVPASALVGAEGDGMKLALGTLDLFRPSVGAAAIGMGRRALDEALAHVEGRVQFGAPLAENAQVQALLADAATGLEAARLLVYRAAWLQDRGEPASGSERGGHGTTTLESSQAKVAATEAAQRAIDTAVQLSGGLGVVRGRIVERLYRAVRALRIYEGASEVMRVVIARELRKRTPGLSGRA